MLQVDAGTDGTPTTLDVHKILPVHETLNYTATTQQQQSLICDLAMLLQPRGR